VLHRQSFSKDFADCWLNGRIFQRQNATRVLSALPIRAIGACFTGRYKFDIASYKRNNAHLQEE
jgi:hypothetical protein